MRAIVLMNLEKPTRNNKTVLREVIHSNDPISAANEFIFWRVNQKNYIKVDNFQVIVETNHGRLIKAWSYKPSY